MFLTIFMNTNQLKEVITSQNEEFLKPQKYVKRELLQKVNSYKDLPHIIILKGIRRCGKSILLKQINEENYDLKKAYINFDDERLLSFNISYFDKLYETFVSLGETKTFFFDEIQNVEEWERAIRRLYDKKIKFYITGSNASMLGKELGTKLTGRYIQLELYPFSFKEYLIFYELNLKKEDFFLTEKKAKIKNYFEKYFSEGGMPEYLLYEKKEIIQQTYEDILIKDILVRYKIENDKQLRNLTKYLLSNTGKLFSYNKLKNILGMGSINTVIKYISYLEDSYLMFELEKYDYSYKKQIQQNKKIYAIDNSFINIVSFETTQNKGRKLENTVFIELKRRGKEVYYHREKHECDFLVREGLKIVEAIQVCYDFNEENEDREIKGLLEAITKHKLKEGLLLTYDEEKELIVENKKITVMPVWKWLLQ